MSAEPRAAGLVSARGEGAAFPVLWEGGSRGRSRGEGVLGTQDPSRAGETARAFRERMVLG